MADIKITNTINTLQSINNSQNKSFDKGFGNILNEAIEKISDIQGETERALKELTAGGNITQAILAIEKADLSFQTMVEIRNKLISAYEEIMRMQV